MKAPILVTGFEPFNGASKNPSWEVVCLLPDQIEGHPVIKFEVPCVFGESTELVCARIRELEPAAVFCVGLAEGRASVTVEEVAVNTMRAAIADEKGVRVHGEPVVEGGPAAYLATIPVADCVAACRAAGVPAHVSDTAGRYVCNQLLYRVLHELAQRGCADVPAGFVHVPCTPDMACSSEKPIPTMSASVSADGLNAIIRSTIC